MMIKINRKVYSGVLLLCGVHIAWAMQPLDDQDLSQSTGQDGITVSINTANDSGTISFDSISLEDGDGFTGQTAAAALSYMTQNANSGITFYKGSAGSYSAIAAPVTFVVDADGNGTNPVMNINIKLDSSLSRINLGAFNLATTTLTNGVINTTATRNILKTGASGVDILFKTGSQVGLNLQLGNQPQGAMFMFTGGQISEIKTDEPIQLVSYTCTSDTACSENSSLKFGFNLKANSASTNGIQLTGMYMDVNSGEGLVFGKSGTMDKFDVTLGNITMGTAGTQNTSNFNNLKNAAIGNIGLTGVAITDLKTTVRGM